MSGSDATDDSATEGGGDDGFTLPPVDAIVPPDPASFDGIYTNTLHRRCASVECHNASKGGLTMSTVDIAYASLVNVPSQGCSPLLRVKPGSPTESALIWKLGAHYLDKCSDAGVEMPVGLPAIPASELDAINTWITNGAKR